MKPSLLLVLTLAPLPLLMLVGCRNDPDYFNTRTVLARCQKECPAGTMAGVYETGNRAWMCLCAPGKSAEKRADDRAIESRWAP